MAATESVFVVSSLTPVCPLVYVTTMEVSARFYRTVKVVFAVILFALTSTNRFDNVPASRIGNSVSASVTVLNNCPVIDRYRVVFANVVAGRWLTIKDCDIY